MPYKVDSSRTAPRKNWIIPDLIKLCNIKSKLYKKFKLNPIAVNIKVSVIIKKILLGRLNKSTIKLC